jgi:large subunit ribosomal protein L4
MSLDIDVRAADGSSAGTVTLDADYFGIEPHVAVLHQVVTAQLAAARAGTQSTKTRAEVSGGGKKPFKQKGTGRARQGSERAPHFSGGGVALGPKPRSYKQRTPRKMINLALRSALSDRHSEGRVAVVGAWGLDTPSTKAARAALTALGVTGRVLVVLSRDDEDAYKSFRNLPDVQVILRGELNAYDILCNEWIVFTPGTLPGHAEPSGDTPVTVGATRTSPAPVDAAPDAPVIDAPVIESPAATPTETPDDVADAALLEAPADAVLSEGAADAALSAAAADAVVDVAPPETAPDEAAALSPETGTDAEEAQ